MKELIITLSVLNILFILLHEFDAFYREEWHMFRFLRSLKVETAYLVFFYAHIPVTLIAIYYLYSVFTFSNKGLWLVWNIVMVLHLIIHLIARKWHSNVFHSIHSFVPIFGAGFTGAISLLLMESY